MNNRMRELDQFERLLVFLNTSDRENIMNIYQVDGYLRALAITTDVLAPKWYSLIFGDENDLLGDKSLLPVLVEIELLFSLHRQEVIAGKVSFPFCGVYTHSHWMIVEAAAWARGFMQGYIVQDAIWERYLAQASDSQLDSFDSGMAALSVLADAQFTLSQGANPAEFAGLLAAFGPVIKQWGQRLVTPAGSAIAPGCG